MHNNYYIYIGYIGAINIFAREIDLNKTYLKNKN